MRIHPKLREAIDAAVQASDHGCLTPAEAERLRKLEIEAQREIAADTLECTANDLTRIAEFTERESRIGRSDENMRRDAFRMSSDADWLRSVAARIRKGEL